MSKLTSALIATMVVAAVAIGWFLWWPRSAAPVAEAPQPEPPAEVAQAPAAPPSAPAVLHPIEAAPAASGVTPGAMPALADSDKLVAGEMNALVGRNPALKFLLLDGFVRRVVATVDNLALPHAAPRMWPVVPSPGKFAVTGAGTPAAQISRDNDLRYSAFVNFVESVDARRAAVLYVQLYPLFQEAYEELGYPGKPFNDRLVAVIDHLLAAPEPGQPPAVRLTEVNGPMQQAQPWRYYEYVDPALEGLSSGQKMLVRMGAVNERRLKAKLLDIRKAVAAAG